MTADLILPGCFIIIKIVFIRLNWITTKVLICIQYLIILERILYPLITDLLKINNSFMYLTFTDVHMGRQKVPNLTFKVNFLCRKIIQSLQFFFIEEYQFRRRFLLFSSLENYHFWTTLFSKMKLNFDGPCEHLWKSNKKNIYILLIFFLKSTPCWLTFAKLHNWGHTN